MTAKSEKNKTGFRAWRRQKLKTFFWEAAKKDKWGAFKLYWREQFSKDKPTKKEVVLFAVKTYMQKNKQNAKNK